MAQEFSYGGQAVIEGVMMRGSRLLAVAVRAPDGNIVLHTRPTLNAIFRRITDRKKSHLFRNPEGFATVFITTIRGALADHIVDRIEFLLPGDRLPTDLDQLFPSSQDFPQRELVPGDAQALYDQIQTDSQVEAHFVRDRLIPDDRVICYFKFPPKFRIPLPKIIGDYNPDWGILRLDDAGQEVGRAHYEPFGETYSSTIPMTLTERLFSGQVLDSSTGLYYYGHGRYYDPSIGRYISPDPYLDAPFSSQRLDRYNFGFNNPLRYQRSEALPDFTVDLAKGSLVAQGVPAAALTSSFGQLTVDLGAARWVVKEAFGAVADAGQQRVLGGFLIGRIAISASKTRLTTMLPREVQALFSGTSALKGTYTKQTVSSGILAMSEAEIAEIRAAIEPLTVVKAGRGSSSRWAATMAQRFTSLDVIATFAVAGVVDFGFSLWQDIPMRDVYGLSGQQIVYRAAVRGVGGLASAGIVIGLWAGIAGTVVCPPLWFAIPVFLCAELFYEQLAVPALYSEFQWYGPYERRIIHHPLDPARLDRRVFIH